MSHRAGRLAAARALVCVCLAVLPGCTSLRLQQSITSQATTLAELHYQQVLNNLAMFSTNPYVLPSHVTIRDGSAQIQDSGAVTAASAFGRSPGQLATGSPGLSGSRTVVEQWGVSPVTDDIALRLIQLAYQRALGMPVLMDLDLSNDLARELSKQTAETSDLNRQNELASINAFRDTFAAQYALGQYARIAAKTQPQEYVASYQEAIGTARLLDHLALQSVMGSNSDKIILEEEYRDDPSLATVDPAFFPARGRSANASAAGTRECVFTPLAQSARKEVVDTQADLLRIGPGWFQTGTRHDVPADACYVGRYQDRYAWVCPQGMQGLSEFTLGILKFSDLVKERSVLTVPGGPRFTPGAGH
jgi:hypothetical protein